MADELEKILAELEAEKSGNPGKSSRPVPPPAAQAPAAAPPEPESELEQELQEKRSQKVAGFQLQLDLDDEFAQTAGDGSVESEPQVQVPAVSAAEDLGATQEMPAVSPASAAGNWTEPMVPQEEPDAPDRQAEHAAAAHAAPKEKGKKRRSRDTWRMLGCYSRLMYVVGVLVVAGVLSYFIIAGGIDMAGINKSSDTVNVVIPEDASMGEITDLLYDNGLISQKLIFRLYAALRDVAGTFQSGEFTLSGSMGYSGLVAAMQEIPNRTVVRVTFPEGIGVLEIAELLEENNVCSATEFLDTVKNGDFTMFDFVKDLPVGQSGYENRVYWLEGYLFPDTYDFYEGDSPTSVVKKFLNNFEARVDTKMRAAIKARGLTVDQAVVFASLLQSEADNPTDMKRVARVIWNRLEDPTRYPKLELDSTIAYATQFFPGISDDAVMNVAYDTYQRDGLPVGAICNPGLDALTAVVNPSEESDIVDCYYFATDWTVDPTVTYYSETYEEHVAICEKYGIGIHA